ncbi:hypothetical protein UNSW2_502 [Campylobacter concisus UNSW2]|uniref:Uncharacterized protein n=1 Tax=Campylobacter concisus UNSW2 TaxID=1242965 RepID=U2GVS7_9BACT|nr:hypothetical protein UNSW2_502 [Campylobacter concisus UNSW2]
MQKISLVIIFLTFFVHLLKSKIKASTAGLELCTQATHERKSRFKKTNV